MNIRHNPGSVFFLLFAICKDFDDIMIDQNGAARDTIFNPEFVVSILQTRFSSMNHLSHGVSTRT